MWLWNEKFPEEMKPNVAKMYFALAPAQDAIQVYVHPQHREKWREPGPQAVIEYFRRQAIHVIIMHGDQRTFLNGYGAALPQEIAKLVEDEHPYVK